jgi:hypothetical protein
MRLDSATSAGRLLATLSTARRTEGGTVRAGWAKVFNLEKRDVGRLMQALASLFALPGTVEREVMTYVPHPERYLEWKTGVTGLLASINLEAAWQPFRDSIKEPDLVHLRHAAYALEQHGPEQALNEDTLAGIRDETVELIRQVKESALSGEVREFVLKHLELILDAIDGYPIAGEEQLRNSTEAALGGVFLNVNLFLDAKPEESSILDKVIAFLSKVAGLVTDVKVLALAGITVAALTLPQSCSDLGRAVHGHNRALLPAGPSAPSNEEPDQPRHVKPHGTSEIPGTAKA